jgi:hypothetical protein
MDSKELLAKWHNGLRMAHKAHEQAAAHFDLRGRGLSVATVVFSTIVGTSIFADAGETYPLAWKLVAGLLSIVAAVLAAVQASLKYSETAGAHRQIARRIGPLRRECEELRVQLDDGQTLPPDTLSSLRKRWDEIDADAPTVPQKIWNRVAASVLREAASPTPQQR